MLGEIEKLMSDSSANPVRSKIDKPTSQIVIWHMQSYGYFDPGICKRII